MTVESGQSAALRCANHPNVETHLKCSRCGKPICVRCVIQTPVGGRCRECAQLRKSPVLIVSPRRYAKAALYGLAVALIGGFIWASMGGMFFGFSWLVFLLLGYLIGEAVSRGADGRISRGLAVMAGGFTVLAALVGPMVSVLSRLPSQVSVFDRLGLALSLSAASLFGNLMMLVFVFLAIVIAVNRIR